MQESDEADIECSGEVVDTAPVVGVGAPVFRYVFAVNFCNHVGEAFGDFQVAADCDVSDDAALVEQVRSIFESVDGDTDAPSFDGYDSADPEYGLVLEERLIYHAVPLSSVLKMSSICRPGRVWTLG